MKPIYLLILIIIICGSASGDSIGSTQEIAGYGKLTLHAASWTTPFNQTEAQKCITSITTWEKEKTFDPYKVLVFPEHELVINLKKEPSLTITLNEQPDIIFLISLKTNGQQILREQISTGNMELLAPPPHQKLELSFIEGRQHK